MAYFLDYAQRVNPSLIHAGLDHLIREMTLNGDGAAEVELRGFSAPWVHDGQPRTRQRVSPPLAWRQIAELSAPAAAQLVVSCGGARRTHSLQLLPACAWDLRRDYAAATAAFVMENSPTVTRIVAGAGCAPDPSGGARPPEWVARRLYEAFLERFRFYYLYERGTLEGHEQIVRFPAQIIHDGGGATDAAGTCIDLALLYAGALRAAACSPVICIAGSEFGSRHAMVGFWRRESEASSVVLGGEEVREAVRRGALIVVEPNWLTQRDGSYDEAVEIARGKITHQPVLWAVDIQAARDQTPPITSMSIMSAGEEPVITDLPAEYADTLTTLRAAAAATVLNRHVLTAVRAANDVDAGGVWPLCGSRVVIGRREEREGRVVLHDRMISRDHAALVAAEDGVYLSDLYSTHGTSLRGELLQPYMQVPLRPGDVFSLGCEAVVLRLDLLEGDVA